MDDEIETTYMLELTPSEVTLLWAQVQAMEGLNNHVFEFQVLKNKVALLWDMLCDSSGTDSPGS